MNEQFAARGKQLLGHQNGKRCPDNRADNPTLDTVPAKIIQSGVITRPERVRPGLATRHQIRHNIPVGIEHTHPG